MVTLYSPYVRRIAKSYKELRNNELADRHVLETIHQAADRCIRAHMRAELRIGPDVKLPMAAVLQMLEYVHTETGKLLEPVPQPEDFSPKPMTSETRSILRRAMERLRQVVEV
jgi:hypothetical protein